MMIPLGLKFIALARPAPPHRPVIVGLARWPAAAKLASGPTHTCGLIERRRLAPTTRGASSGVDWPEPAINHTHICPLLSAV